MKYLVFSNFFSFRNSLFLMSRLFLDRLEKQPTAAATTAAASDRGAKVIGLVDVDRQTRLPRTYFSSGHRKCTCENRTAELRRHRWSAVLILLSTSSSTRCYQRAPATELLWHPGGALSSSTSCHYSSKITRVLVINNWRLFALKINSNALEDEKHLFAVFKNSPRKIVKCFLINDLELRIGT